MATLMLGRQQQAFVRAAWSMGWASAVTLTGLVCAWGVRPRRAAVTALHRDGYLEWREVATGRSGRFFFYGAGEKAGELDPAYRQPWRPPESHMAHTMACGDTVVALRRPGLLPGLAVVGWAGEVELRGEAAPGAPYPDAAVEVAGAGGESVRLLLEVDRGTEARAAFCRKLARYAQAATGEPVLAVTPSDARARTLARHAVALGVPMLACAREELAGRDPVVYDAGRRRRRPLVEALGDALAESDHGTFPG